MSLAPFLLIVNPAAGAGRGAAIGDALAAALTARGETVHLEHTAAPGDATRLAAAGAGEHRAVVAVGGDGTAREVIAGLLGRGVPAGFCPAGTANMLAREFGLPRAPAECAAVIAAGHTALIDVGRASGEPFVLVAGAGFDGEVVRAIDTARRGGTLTGMQAYVGPLITALAGMNRGDLEVTVDGELVSTRAHWVLVANGRNYGGVFEVAGYAQPTDGFLDVCLFEKNLKRRFVYYLLLGLIRRLCRSRDLRYFRGRRIEVRGRSDRPAPYQLDGDFGGETPVQFEIVPEGVPLLVSAATAARLAPREVPA